MLSIHADLHEGEEGEKGRGNALALSSVGEEMSLLLATKLGMAQVQDSTRARASAMMISRLVIQCLPHRILVVPQTRKRLFECGSRSHEARGCPLRAKKVVEGKSAGVVVREDVARTKTAEMCEMLNRDDAAVWGTKRGRRAHHRLAERVWRPSPCLGKAPFCLSAWGDGAAVRVSGVALPNNIGTCLLHDGPLRANSDPPEKKGKQNGAYVCVSCAWETRPTPQEGGIKACWCCAVTV